MKDLPTAQEIEALQRLVDLLDGKAPEGYVAKPLIAKQAIEAGAVTYARWVLALTAKKVTAPYGPLNQCEHENMQSEDNVHWYCPDCILSFDDGGEGGVHGLEEEEELERLQELKDWPAGIPTPSKRYPGKTTFTVRVYDMFEGWIDVRPNVSENEAMDCWLERTNYGRICTKYSDGNYYDIFPSDAPPEVLGR